MGKGCCLWDKTAALRDKKQNRGVNLPVGFYSYNLSERSEKINFAHLQVFVFGKNKYRWVIRKKHHLKNIIL